MQTLSSGSERLAEKCSTFYCKTQLAQWQILCLVIDFQPSFRKHEGNLPAPDLYLSSLYLIHLKLHITLLLIMHLDLCVPTNTKGTLANSYESLRLRMTGITGMSYKWSG